MIQHHLLYLYVVILTVTAGRRHGVDESDYRLLWYITTHHYKLHFTIPEDFPTKMRVYCTAEITFSLKNDLAEGDAVYLNAYKLDIQKTEVRLADGKSISNNVTNIDRRLQRFGFVLNEDLPAMTECVLNIDYTVKLSKKNSGLYAIPYKYQNRNVWIIGTQLQPVHARKVFPCFDEPIFKAVFNITVSHPKRFTAFSNVEAKSRKRDPENSKLFRTEFRPTQKISPHLVALIVSEAVPKSKEFTYEQVKHKFRLLKLQDYAASVMAKVIDVFTEITRIKPYNIGLRKIDHLGVPGFAKEVMANWGLITYRELGLYISEAEATAIDKQNIASLVVHAYAHMFFGNIRICDWWNNLWLSEGTSRFFRYYVLDKMNMGDDWEMMYQFVVEELQPMLGRDSLYNTAPLSERDGKVLTPDKIEDAFNYITYSKGACMLWMVSHILGQEAFMKGIKTYMSGRYIKYFENVNAAAFWEAWSSNLYEHILPEGVSLAYVMSKWITRAGYPVVYVAMQDNNIHLTAAQFVSNTVQVYSVLPNIWYIPITYTTSKSPNFKKTIPTQNNWIVGTETLILKEDLTEEDSWIVVNLQSTAYIRVQYDVTLWYRLQRALLTDHRQIHVLNRAQIIDDAIHLALTDSITHGFLTRLLLYLKEETDYYPWRTALERFEHFKRRIDDNQQDVKLLYKYIRTLIPKVYYEVQVSIDSRTNIDVLKRKLIMKWACRIHYSDCVANANEQFVSYIADGAIIDPNARSYVFCTGIEHTGKNEWDNLYKKLNDTDSPSLSADMIGGLACTNDMTRLKVYLERTIDPRSQVKKYNNEKIFISVISQSREGVHIGLAFLLENYHEMITYYAAPKGLEQVIADLGQHIRTIAEAGQYVRFIDSYDLREKWQSVRIAVENCEEYGHWIQFYKSEFLEGLTQTHERAVKSNANACKKYSIFILVSLVCIVILCS